MIKKEGVKITEEDESDIQMSIDDVTPEIRTNYGKDSLQYILRQEQKKYNLLQNKCQMRWHPLVIRFALIKISSIPPELLIGMLRALAFWLYLQNKH